LHTNAYSPLLWARLHGHQCNTWRLPVRELMHVATTHALLHVALLRNSHHHRHVVARTCWCAELSLLMLMLLPMLLLLHHARFSPHLHLQLLAEMSL